MATITPSLSTKVDARGKSEILLRFVGGRDHVYRIHSCIFVAPSRWKDGEIVVPRLEGDEQRELLETQAKLDALVAFILEKFSTADKYLVSAGWMRRTVAAFHNPATQGGKPAALLETFDLFIERTAPRISEARVRRYRVVRGALERWDAYHRVPAYLDGIDAEDLRDFERFVSTEDRIAEDRRFRALYPDGAPEPRGRNTVLEYLAVLRTFYNWARKEGRTHNDPFLTFQGDTALYGTPYYITVDEVDQLYNADLSARPRLAVQRDIFVFQCQVGCRVGDLLRFRVGDVSDGVLEYIPGKTRSEHPRTVRVPLNARAQEIIKRYEHEAYPRLLPFISAQKYNEAIKDAFRLSGLTRQVTVLDPLTRREVKLPLDEIASSHLARRTFIGNLYRVVKDPNLIASMSGHTEGSRAFARYRSIDDDLKTELVSILDGEKPL